MCLQRNQCAANSGGNLNNSVSALQGMPKSSDQSALIL